MRGGTHDGDTMQRRSFLITGLGYFLIATTLAVLLRGLRFDDPFITYRFAAHLAAGQGFVFNPNDAAVAAPALITTTPLYALVLAGLQALGLDIPSASHWIGAGSLFAAALALYSLTKDRIAGLCLILFPLLWLTLGFETPLFIAVSLWAFGCVVWRRPVLAGLLCGIAMGLRGDGVIVLGVACAVQGSLDPQPMLQRWRGLIPIVVSAMCAYLPLAVWLTLQFGSPIPSTLITKSAQAISGLTGFYSNTRFPEGAVILIQALVQQGGLFVVTLAIMLIGIGELATHWRGRSAIWAPVAWLLAHFAGYSLIGVAPYVWYYAPMIPGVCVLLGLGLAWLRRRLHGTGTLFARRVGQLWSWVLSVALITSLLIGDALIFRIVHGGMPPNPALIESKVLPETKVDVYERVGRWIAANTPITATLGVTELGVMSYYAQRQTVDFLGLTQPQHIADIRHGDFLAGLLREQPDYVALNGVNALYDINPQREAWFTYYYTPVARFDDARFWASPMTLWQRVRPPITTTVTLYTGNADLGDGWQITDAQSNTRLAEQATPILLRLQLRAGKPLGNRLLRVQPVLVEGGDGLPVSSRIIYTDRWRAGEQRWVDVLLQPAANAHEGAYIIQAQWLEGGPVTNVGALKIRPNLNDAPALDTVLLLNKTSGIGVLPMAVLSACAGSTPNLVLIWRGGDTHNHDYTVFVHARDAANGTVAQGDGPPRNGGALYPTSVWGVERIADTHALPIPKTLAPGTYAIVVGLYDPTTEERLPVDPVWYRTPDGGVKIGELVVKSC